MKQQQQQQLLQQQQEEGHLHQQQHQHQNPGQQVYQRKMKVLSSPPLPSTKKNINKIEGGKCACLNPFTPRSDSYVDLNVLLMLTVSMTVSHLYQNLKSMKSVRSLK